MRYVYGYRVTTKTLIKLKKEKEQNILNIVTYLSVTVTVTVQRECNAGRKNK